MSINKKTVDTAILECERFLERARLVAALGYEYAGVTYTAALKRSCAEVRNAMVAVKKEVGAEEWEEECLQRSIQKWNLREKLDHKGGSDE